MLSNGYDLKGRLVPPADNGVVGDDGKDSPLS
jgi:hypothetical protein